MRVAVIGAGIVGITTAHRLARQGHKVCVFEQRSTPAEEASFAIPGLLGLAYASEFAFNHTGNPSSASFWSSDHGLRLANRFALSSWTWVWKWLRQRKHPEQTQDHAALTALVQRSFEQFAELAHELSWEFENTAGLTVLMRDESERLAAQPIEETCKTLGLNPKWLDTQATRQLELALNTDTALHGALHFPAEPTANCRQVALLHKRECDALGVEFKFDHHVAPLKPGNAAIVHARSGDGPYTTYPHDAVVVCAGQGSDSLLGQVAPKLPLAEVHGYSISAQIREPLNAPRTTCLDFKRRIFISRLGQRVRVGGISILGKPSPAQRLSALRDLYKTLLDWYPGACHMQQVQEWSGTRICTPDGLPIIGPTSEPGIWLNLAHGDLGWALAEGAAEGIADMLSGTPVDEVQWQRFSPLRWG